MQHRHPQGGHQHQLPRLGLPPLKDQEEGQHTLQQNQKRREIILPAAEVVDAHEERQGNQQHDHERSSNGPLLQLAFFHLRLQHIGRRMSFPADAEGKCQKRHKQNPIQQQLTVSQSGKPPYADQLAQICDANGLHNQNQGKNTRDGGQELAPKGQRRFLLRFLFGLGQRPFILRQRRFRFNFAAAGSNHILCRDGFRQQLPCHAVGGGGVEAVAGEERPGCALRDNGAAKKQGASVGIFRAERNIMAHHQHRRRAVRAGFARTLA